MTFWTGCFMGGFFIGFLLVIKAWDVWDENRRQRELARDFYWRRYRYDNVHPRAVRAPTWLNDPARRYAEHSGNDDYLDAS